MEQIVNVFSHILWVNEDSEVVALKYNWKKQILTTWSSGSGRDVSFCFQNFATHFYVTIFLKQAQEFTSFWLNGKASYDRQQIEGSESELYVSI